ncbi:N-acetylglucosamine-6-phosphate deacetylase [Brucella endophytica]|uniref:N-acetylglucosamine-6-phosphate deacetylase n=1 Tax=Brucella endophytica TaxID=1963359 RepID=A0A916SFK9_9HYPH|nr:N-acetylglucosamine-6-phosphate deacetylase [Brucella endophytica]GGA93937.1 N-acetylglucosamine-6-phosphate deacetylase [Brucella endophytica]
MTTLRAITAARIFDGSDWHENSALLVKNEHVVGIVPVSAIPGDADRIDYDGQQIVPGFIDLQVNGGGGVRFGEETSLEAIRQITNAHARFGTTKLLPTLITDTPEVTARALEAGRQAHAAKIPGFLGLHLEGPHLSIERKGAHNPSFIRPMTADDLAAICRYRKQAGFLLTTIAPENVSAEQVAKLVEAGVVVSLGHSDATLRTARAYFDAGASMVTHLFNAMSPLGNREPGIVGAALEDGRIYAGLIADGFHVDPVTMKIALRSKKLPGDIFLVTDAMQTIGTALARFELNGRPIHRSAGSLRLADGTLAGADIDMLASVKFVHQLLGLSLERTLAMASSIPAKAVGLNERYGFLKPNCVADFIVLSDRLDHVATWIDGDRSVA